MPESVNHTEQRGVFVDPDRDRLVTRAVLAWKRATRGCPLDRPEPAIVTHGQPRAGTHFHISTAVPRPTLDSTINRSIRRRAPGKPIPNPRPVEYPSSIAR